MQSPPKVLCIGFDAADCAYIESHAQDLPNFAAFLQGGGLHRLDVEPLSGAVWPTFLSGTTPDHHGFFHHMQWDPASLRIRRAHPDWIGHVRPFWRDLAAKGTKVAAFDVPFVFRGDTQGALEVSNWGSHDLVEPPWCSDPATWARITKVAKRHPMRFEVPVRKSRRQLEPMLDAILHGTKQKTDIALDLIAQADWDMCLIVYGETHRGGHIFWPDPAPDAAVPSDALARIYKAADAGLGRLLAAVDDTTHVVIFALHGMAHNQSQSHLSRPMLDAALGIGAAEPEKPGFGLIRALRGAVPHGIQHRIAEHVPMAVRDFVLARELIGGLDWDSTKAFSLQGDVSGYWRLNVAGREKHGIVTDPDALRASIAKVFQGFQTAEGRPLVDRVHFPSAEGQGSGSALLPDILVEWTEDLKQQTSAVGPTGTITGQPDTGRTGNHRFRGFIAHRGPPGFAPPQHIKDIGDSVVRLLQAP